MRPGGLAVALATVAILLSGCGGSARAAPPQPPVTAHPSAAPRAARLLWRAGDAFNGQLSFSEQDRGAVDDQLTFTAEEQFSVVRLSGGIATLRRTLVGWRWQRNTSAYLTTDLPPPATFGVDATGRIVWGLDWPLAGPPPLPGLDLFAAPLGGGSEWSRTDGAGVAVPYQTAAGASAAATMVRWSVEHPQFTSTGEKLLVSGQASAALASSYAAGSGQSVLRSTTERATYRRTTGAPGGTTFESGLILQRTSFTSG